MVFEHMGSVIIRDENKDLDIQMKYRIHADIAIQKVNVEFMGYLGVDSKSLKAQPGDDKVDVMEFLNGIFSAKDKGLIQEHTISKENLDRLKSIIIAREL